MQDTPGPSSYLLNPKHALFSHHVVNFPSLPVGLIKFPFPIRIESSSKGNDLDGPQTEDDVHKMPLDKTTVKYLYPEICSI